MRERWQVYEVVNAEGLPIRVMPLRISDDLPTLNSGERIRWLAAACCISGCTARRLARERLKMMGRFYNGQPPWLQQAVPRDVGNQRPRPVCRVCGDRVELFGSVKAAARAVERSRKWIHLRLIDGLADFNGCRWIDAPTACDQERHQPREAESLH